MKFSYLNGYNVTLDKIKKFNKRKIIFLGGSNVGFGIHSNRIENHLGIKTFNLGIHGGIGLKKSINDIYNNLNEDDIVILCPEYRNFDINQYSDEKNRIDFIKTIGVFNILNFESFVHYLVHIKKNLSHFIFGNHEKYNINWFNENGDIIGHYDMQDKSFNIIKQNIDINKSKLKVLKAFIDQKLNGVQYFVFPPATLMDAYNREQLNKLNQSLIYVFENKYPLTINKMTFDRNCFFDTKYHLNYDCGRQRTEMLLDFLINII